MRVSSKITRSFYYFLHSRGFDVSRFFELTSLEVEFLKDVSHWLPAHSVESLLHSLSKEYAAYFVDQDFITGVGRACFRLNAWGALDSVLKMKTTKPIFDHLSVFLSYFIENCHLSQFEQIKGHLQCHCSVSSEDYPFITGYLRAVLEALPLYMGQELASVKWIQHRIQIEWEEENEQASLFKTARLHFKPDLLNDFRNFLDNLENEMRKQKKLLQEKDKEITRLRNILLSQGITKGEREPEQDP